MDSESPSAAVPAQVVRAHEPGGRFPNPGVVVQETLAEFMDAIVPYLLSVLGLIAGYAVLATVVSGAVVVIWVVVGAIVGLAATGFAQIDEGLAGLVTTGGMLIGLGVQLITGALGVAAFGALAAPLQASYLRAVAAHQRGDEELQLGSAFSTIGQDVAQVALAGALVGLAGVVGMMLCFFPVLLVPLLLGFVVPLVALHGLGATEAIRTNVMHVRNHLQEHAIIALIVFALNMVAGMVPVLGPAFVLAFVVRVYRNIFGDGVQPQLALADGSLEAEPT